MRSVAVEYRVWASTVGDYRSSTIFTIDIETMEATMGASQLAAHYDTTPIRELLHEELG